MEDPPAAVEAEATPPAEEAAAAEAPAEEKPAEEEAPADPPAEEAKEEEAPPPAEGMHAILDNSSPRSCRSPIFCYDMCTDRELDNINIGQLITQVV